MNKLKFWKLQSIGNDFVLIHIEDVMALPGLTPESLKQTLSQLAIKACDRRFGIGSDGLLTVQMTDGVLEMRMFNPDGTEDFCGNGLRCAAWHAFKLGWVGESFSMKHLDRTIAVTVKEGRVATNIGLADYTPEKVPHKGGELFNKTVWSGMDSGMPLSLFGSALTTGSTHVVIPTSVLPDDDSFRSISAKIEVDSMYPDRTSVIWTKEVEPMILQIRIWERGVGETMGCGTGSSAAAADYLRRKGRGGSVVVRNPGGEVTASMEAWNAAITLEGTAQEVFDGVLLTV